MWNELRREVQEGTKLAPWTIWRVAVRVVLPIMGVVLVLGGVLWTCGIVGTPAKVLEKTLDPDRVIYNYEWFGSAYQHVRALDQQIVDAQQAVTAFETAAGARTGWDYNDKQEDARLHAILDGLRQQRHTEAAEYNARSAQKTRNFTKSDNLPERLED